MKYCLWINYYYYIFYPTRGLYGTRILPTPLPSPHPLFMCQFLLAVFHQLLLISFSPHVCKLDSFKYRKWSPIIWIVFSFLTPFYSYPIKLEQKVTCKIIYGCDCHDDLNFFFCGCNVWFSLFTKSELLNLILVMHLMFFYNYEFSSSWTNRVSVEIIPQTFTATELLHGSSCNLFVCLPCLYTVHKTNLAIAS